ncbi:MAG: cytidine/deoxycytidylate deaminase family protein [Candidatus Margulisiibacteriota bacterium]
MSKPKILRRPDWDTYFMNIADVVSTRATCVKRQVGSVITKEEQIIATGYNGAPRGLRHSAEVGCLRQQLDIPSGTHHELCRGLHAEQNAIIQAARNGIDTKGATLYCTYMPCVICSKMIINAGISRIVFRGYYPDELAIQILNESGIDVSLFEEKYRDEPICEVELSDEEKARYKL